MDNLTADGFVILGGPLGEGGGEDALLVVDAPDEDAIRFNAQKRSVDQKAGILEIETIQRWTIFLEAEKK